MVILMLNEQKYLIEIKQKKLYLQQKLKETTDALERKVIAYSLSNYIQIEHGLSNLNIFVDRIGKFLLKRDFLAEKVTPYFKIMAQNWNYCFQELDLEYVNSLTSILANSYSFDIPKTIVCNDSQLINITKKFYLKMFKDKVKDKGYNLSNYSKLIFSKKDSLCEGVVGKSYFDPYFSDNYFFIKRNYNDMDLLILPHEIFHGINFKMNFKSILDSIQETQEVGTATIEFICCDFLDNYYSPTGTNLKKSILLDISNRFLILKNDFSMNGNSIDNIINFLVLESKIVGYGIYQIYLDDKKRGEDMLLEFCNHNFSRESFPDYSDLGFSKDIILSLAKKMVEERNRLILINNESNKKSV